MTTPILPDELPHALDGAKGVGMLSLDCFDTLLWRDVHAPVDLFGVLDALTPDQRIRAESTARKARTLATRKPNEVTLREIYDTGLPGTDAATRERAVAAELAAEIRHCHAFAPTVALMRAAKARGLKVIVVSDTYLERDQLEALIRGAAGDAVADLIDRIFCSSEYRRAKNQGLFEDVLRATSVRPGRILHIGDNPVADVIAPQRHGIRSRHLVQFTPSALKRMRQEVAAGRVAMPGKVAFMPQRAAIAIAEPRIDDPAEALGFTVLGPALARFADWVAEEADALAATRPGKVHTLFMLRDGYLPHQIFQARHPDRPSSAVEISRFTGTAAAMGVPGMLERFIVSEITHETGTLFLKQVLLDEAEAKTMVAELPRDLPGHAMNEALRSDRWAPTIRERGRTFAARLIEHVRAMVAPAPGDTLMLVDLGYSGTVQNRVAPVLEEALGVHVAGRYFLLREDWATVTDKRGMIAADRHDGGLLTALLKSIAVVEQLCTVAQGSVIDYEPDGTPIRAGSGIKGRQSAIRDRVQAGCLTFARTEAAAVIRATDPARGQTRDHAAVAGLARFLTLPLPHEVALLADFQHDGNLGGDYMTPLFDPMIASAGLRERGLVYLKRAERMFLPGELSGQGMSTSMTHMTLRRFELDLVHEDFCDRAITLPLLIADGVEAFHDSVVATPTHDDYYCAAIPVGAARFTIGLPFGQFYDWLQIASVRFVPVEAFARGGPLIDHLALPALPSCEGMEQVAPNLFRCDGPEAFLMVPPPADESGRALMLLVAFRPLVTRETAPADTLPSPVEVTVQ